MPLTAKGTEILSSMQKQYGEDKGKKVFYASKTSGAITGVDSAKLDAACSKMDALNKREMFRKGQEFAQARCGLDAASAMMDSITK